MNSTLSLLINTLKNDRFLGFDELADSIQKNFENLHTYAYPPYDYYAETDTIYVLEFALAGFTRDEINVEVEQKILTVSGKKSSQEDSETGRQYHHKGLKTKDFVNTFRLHEYVDVKDATFENGLLKITLEKNIPERDKPKKIELK